MKKSILISVVIHGFLIGLVFLSSGIWNQGKIIPFRKIAFEIDSIDRASAKPNRFHKILKRKISDPISTAANHENTTLGKSTDAYPYGLKIRDLIASQVAFPYFYRELMMTGKALIKIFINEDGSVASAGIEKSSGHSELDQLALRAVSKAAPFPVPPQKLSLLVPIHFELN